jgi:purine-nucleoside phosphorylase
MDESLSKRLAIALDSLGGNRKRTPRIGIVLGSGLGEFASKVKGIRIPYSSIAGFPLPSVAGHHGVLTLGGDLAILAGRIHYYEGRPIDDVVFSVFFLYSLGVRTLIVTNAAGGINRSYAPGDLVLIKDHINLMGVNPLRGPNPDLGPRFPDMSTSYSAPLRAAARKASDRPLAEGVYAALSGPSYETPAEISMLAAMGADMVGMSTVPEVIAARYLAMDVLGVSCITNMAAGILPEPLDHAEVIARGTEAAPRFAGLLEKTVRELGAKFGDG